MTERLGSRLRVCALGLALTLFALGRHADGQEPSLRRFALVIGNNRAPGLATLQFADDDAVAQHRLLLEAGVQSRLLVSLDEKTREFQPNVSIQGTATLAHLEREVAVLQAAIRAASAQGQRTELILFFSGHGNVVGGQGQLLLEDAPFSRSDLYELLVHSGADSQLVIVDACSSFFMVVRDKGGGAEREPFDATRFPRLVPADLENTGFILSNSSDRESHEWALFESGVLSYEVRSALRGGADVDLDGRVTYAELRAFIARANESIPQRRLRPDPWVVPPGRGEAAWDEPVIAWNATAASVRVQPNAMGHFFVENGEGERLLDAHPASGQALNLYLPPERPLFLRDEGEDREYEIENPELVAIDRSTPSQSRGSRPKGARAMAFRQLFALPFGLRFVDEYRRTLAAPAAEESSVERPGAGRWESALGYAALGAGAGALTLSGVAFVTSLGGGSQAAVARQNSHVEVERTLALGLAGLGALAASSWAVLRWGRANTATLQISSGGARDGVGVLSGARVSLGGSF